MSPLSRHRAHGRGAAVAAVEVSRVASGAVLVVTPRRVVAVVERGGPGGVSRGPVVVAVVLGVRHLVQGIGTLWAPDDSVAVLGAAVDAVHAVTMVPFAAFPGRHRRAAVVNVVTSTVFAGLGVWAARAR